MHSIAKNRILPGNKFFGIMCVAILSILLSPIFAFADPLVINPDAVTVSLLHSVYSHEAPEYDALAACDNSVSHVNEFHKEEAEEKAVSKLKARFASLSGTKEIVVNLDSTLSVYDSDNKEYNFDINDGSFISFRDPCGKEYRLSLNNGTAAQTWAINEKAAEEVLLHNKGERNVTLVLKLILQDSPVALDGQPIIINSKIKSYEIISSEGGSKLGTVAVPEMNK